MNHSLHAMKHIFILLILCGFGSSIWSQNAYFENSTYIDNGTPFSFKNYDYQSYNDPEINRIYYYGSLNSDTYASPSNPGNFYTTNGTNLDTNSVGFYSFLIVTDTSGNIIYSTIEPFGPGSFFNIQLYSKDGDVYLYGTTQCDSLSTTNNTTPTPASNTYTRRGYILKYSSNTISTNGTQVDYATYIGDSINTELHFLQHDGNTLWALCRTSDSTLPKTQIIPGSYNNSCYLIGITDAMISANTALTSTPYAIHFKSSITNLFPKGLLTKNGNLYMLIRNLGGSFTPLTQTNSPPYETVLVKMSANTLNNNLAFTANNGNYSTYLPVKPSFSSTPGQNLLYSNNKLIFCGSPDGTNLPLTTTGYPFHNQALTIVAISENTMSNNLAFSGNNGDYMAQTGMPILGSSRIHAKIYQGDLYIYSRSGSANPNNLSSLTNNNTAWGSTNLYIQKIKESTLINNIAPNTTPNDWIQFYGTDGTDNNDHLAVNKNGVHLTATTNVSTNLAASINFPTNYNEIFPTTSSYNKYGWYINLCLDGYMNYSTLLSKSEFTNLSLSVTDHATYLTGKVTNSLNTNGTEPPFPLTHTNSNWGGEQNELSFQKIIFNADVTIDDSIFPVTQNVCKFSTPEPLSSPPITFPSDSLPNIYLEGQTLPQYLGGNSFAYQWQVSDSPNGPWTDIQGANLSNYLPTVTTFDKYYRRITYIDNCNNLTFFAMSNVSAILVNTLTAPTVDAGGPFHSCPNIPLNIGGAPTAIGGLAPYTYVWNQNIDSVANPLFSTSQNAILELTVIDGNGCIKKDQAVFYVHQANAGIDRAICDGTPTTIGTALQGLSGVSYSWTPSTGLSCTTCPTPTATPTSPTQYVFTQTLQLIDGTSCSTSDTINLDLVAGPGPNFAGPDTTMCFYSSVNLGTVSQAGFIYEWSPLDGLTAPNNSVTAFYPTSLTTSSNLNPITYTLTAQNQNCFYTDDVTITYILANAGPDVCDSGAIGTIDNTPNFNENYTWSLVSGQGDITGATTTPTSSAYTVTGQSTVLELEVNYNGTSCFDQVAITDCGGAGSASGVGSSSSVSCPSNLLAGDTITLTATPIQNPNVVYNWTPQSGLSAYTGQQVELWTNQHMYYFVTSLDTATNQVLSYDSVEVNNPQWTIPSVSLLDTLICVGSTVGILENYNSNYTYYWSGLPYGAGTSPYVTPSATSNYYVTVMDNASGCTATDTSTILVDNKKLYKAAGSDINTCSNDIVHLGIAEDTAFTYLWSPAIAPWQNGTDQFDADPYVSLSTSTEFFLTYTTNWAGCVYEDSVMVTISDQPVAPIIPDESICYGSYTNVNLGYSPDIDYQWSPASAVNCTDCYYNLLSPSTTTVYTVNVYYENSAVCPDSSSTSFTVFVSDPSFNLTDFTYCNDGTPTSLLNSNPPTGFTQYDWTPSNLVSNPSIMAPDANLVNGNYQLSLTVTDTAGCTATEVVNISPSLATPNAGFDQTVCLSDLPVIIGNASNTGLLSWSPVAGIADPTAAQTTFTTTIPGTYNLVLSSTVNGCSQTDTVTITVNPLPTTPALTDQMICSYGCVDIGMNPTPGLTYQWSPVTGLNATNTATTTACVSQTSQYDLEITDQNGCSSTGSVNIIVNNVPPPAVNLPPLTACHDDPNININYQVNPTTGNYGYNWLPATYFANPTAATQSINTPAIGNHTITLEILDQSTGCIGSASTTITVLDCNNTDTCFANIDLNLSTTSICSNDTVSFQITSDTLPINYAWTYTGFSGNGTGSAPAGTIVYPNNINQIDTVHFHIQPQLATCFVEAVDSFFIVYPTVQPNINANLLYCAGDSSLFYTNDNYVTYNWNGTINTDSSAYFTAQNNPILIEITDTNNCTYSEEFNIAEHNWQVYYDTTYICMNDSILIHGNYETTSGNYVDTFPTALCDSISVVTLLINANVTVNNTFTAITICEGDDVQLNLSGANDYYLAGSSITANEILSPDSTTTIIVLGEGNNGCSDTLSIQITVNYTDSVTLIPPDISCDYFEGTLMMQSSDSLSNCQWTLTNGTTLNDCAPYLLLNTIGCFDVSFSAIDQNGCTVSASANNFICIEEGPQAYFTMNPSTPTTSNSQVTFTSQASNASSIEWMINQENFTGGQVHYTFPNTPNTYEVCFFATSDLGCVDTNCIELEIADELILFVPNTFTPDGNALNNEFRAIASTEVETFEIQIFNRWGEVIFESKNIDAGWDGTYKGKLCQDGVYTWKIKYKETDNPEPIYMQGHVTLIK